MGEFHAPVPPQDLLDPTPDAIWPALMRCDLLPVVGNNAGDFLCAVIGKESTDTEFVHWFHGGGDWIPWGKSLPEALLFDAVNGSLPGPTKAHAIPAEDPRPPANASTQTTTDPLFQWAQKHLPTPLSAMFDRTVSPTGHAIAEAMFQNDVCFEALRLRMIEAALDGQAYPFSKLDALQLAEEVIDRRVDLAWAHHIAAHEAKLKDDREASQRHWLDSCGCSVFTDQSVRLGHVWNEDVAIKFGSAMLLSLEAFQQADSPHPAPNMPTDKGKVTNDALDEAQKSLAAGDSAAAYDHAIRAGWDVGAANLAAYEDIIKAAMTYADAAGQTGRRSVARTHLSCFLARYAAS